MPVVAYFSAKPTSGKAFSQATTFTVNGQPITGHWYFENSAINAGYPVEGHFRPDQATGSATAYWPAHATVHMDMKTQGVSAGPGMAFDDSLTLDFTTGDAVVSYVDGSTETMRVTVNGQDAASYKVSLGNATYPTYQGIKVVMQLGEDDASGNPRPNGTVLMSGPGYTNDKVQWSVRLTASGEYIHAAPWNGEIGARSTSHGCTNMHTADAMAFYQTYAHIGDVVVYTNTGGGTMPSWDGFGDWNVSAAVWNAGGVVSMS